MKLKHLLLAAVAALPFLASCEKPQNLEANIKVNPAVLSVEAGSAIETISVTAGRDWSVTSSPDWIDVAPSSGKASASAQTVTLAIKSNSGNNREGTVTFSIGLMKASVKVSQKGEAGELLPGSGTKEDPYTVMGAIAYVQGLGADVESPSAVYVKGIISDVETTFEGSGTFGNATFNMVDFEGATDKFKAYQTLYLGNRKWAKGDKEVKAGDEVIVYGKIYNFKGNTPETVGRGASYVYSLNGEVAEEVDYSTVPSKTVAEFIAAADKVNYYKLTGKVSKFNSQYCSFNLTDDTGEIYVYSVANKSEWASKIENGGTVVLAGLYDYYADKSQHEVVSAQILSFEPGQAQTEITDATVAEFIKSDGSTYYRLTGKVTGFQPGHNDYMQFNLTDATGTVIVYGFKDRDASYQQWASKIKDNGTVVLTGTYEKYTDKNGNVKDEVMNATIESFTEGEEQSEFEKITVAEFIQKADQVTYYELAGKVSDFETHVANNGNTYMSFNLTDNSGTIYVYGFAEGQIEAWKDKIVDGGDVVLRGVYKKYQETHEVVNATIVSFQADANYKYCRVDGSKDIKVKADATEAEVKIKANAAWTLSASEGATLSAASGEADAAVTVTFPANTSETEAKVYTLTLTCEAASVNETITITQAKAGAAGAGEYELDLSTATYKSASANQVVWETDFFTITVDKDGASTDANNYLGGGKNSQGNTITSSRFYSKSKVTITPAAGKKLTSLVWTATTTNYATAFGNSTWTNASAAASGTTVTVTPTNGGANISAAIGGTCGFTKVVVSYE